MTFLKESKVYVECGRCYGTGECWDYSKGKRGKKGPCPDCSGTGKLVLIDRYVNVELLKQLALTVESLMEVVAQKIEDAK